MTVAATASTEPGEIVEGEGEPHAALIGRSLAPGPPAVVEIGEAARPLSVDHREGLVELFDGDACSVTPSCASSAAVDSTSR